MSSQTLSAEDQELWDEADGYVQQMKTADTFEEKCEAASRMGGCVDRLDDEPTKVFQKAILTKGAAYLVSQLLPEAKEDTQILEILNGCRACAFLQPEGAKELIDRGVYNCIMNLWTDNVEDHILDQLCLVGNVIINNASFYPEAHKKVIECGALPKLMAIVADENADTDNRVNCCLSLMYLSLNTEIRDILIEQGADKVLMDVYRKKEPEDLMPSTVQALAVMVGHDERNKELLEAGMEIVETLIVFLHHAVRRIDYKRRYYNAWKVLSSLKNFSINDSNKRLLREGGVIPEILIALKDPDIERSLEYGTAILWNLAFLPENKPFLKAPEVMEQLNRMANHSNPTIKKNAEGALWLLKDERPKTAAEEKKSADDKKDGHHIMLSYNWAAQETIVHLRKKLGEAGFKVWIDVEQMGGSTLEAMALAIEAADIIVMAVSSKYKESANCRLEAEYSFQKKKTIVPIIVETGYSADGWLGAIMGTKLWFDLSDAKRFEANLGGLIKEVQTKLSQTGKQVTVNKVEATAPKSKEDEGLNAVAKWDEKQVGTWLEAIGLRHLSEKFAADNMDGVALMHFRKMYKDSATNWILPYLPRLGLITLGHQLRFLKYLSELPKVPGHEEESK